MIDIDKAAKKFKKRIDAMSDSEVLAYMDSYGLKYSFTPTEKKKITICCVSKAAKSRKRKVMPLK